MIIIIVHASILVQYVFMIIFVVFIFTKSEVQLRFHHLDFGSVPSPDFWADFVLCHLTISPSLLHRYRLEQRVQLRD